MKKILLGTTALVAVTAVTAGTAKADMSVTGWNTFGLGVGDVKASRGGPPPAGGDIDIYENGEIYFNGSTEMDNGISLSWDVQLETENGNGNFIDENYFTISGDFGSVQIGQENLPNYKMHYSGGMWVGNAGLSSNHYTQFTGAPGGLSYFHSGFMNDTAPIGNDADMIAYYTPRMSGVQVGVGWQPDSKQNDGRGDEEKFEDTLSLGANYVTDMDGTSIAASVGYVDTNQGTGAGGDPREGVQHLQFGLRVGFGGLTLGASYAEQTDDKNITASGDTDNIFVGAKYATGPHTIGLSAVFAEAEADPDNKKDTEGKAYLLAHDYAMGGGVSLTTAVVYLDVDSEDGGTANAKGPAGTIMLNAAF